MNIPNNFTNKDAELYKSAIIIDLKDRVIEHRVLTITKTLEDTAQIASEIAELHDVILIVEQRRPKRAVGACEYPMIIHYN